MAGKRLIISNKSNKPDNIVMHEAEIYSKCEEIEALMPRFMRSFFIYLRGNVLPIGGLKEKSLAAHRSGIDTILIPKENVKDLDDVPQEVKDAVTFIPCSNVSQVLHNALVK